MSVSVLAIDDSPTIRGMVEAALTGAGFDVTLADDGVAGLEALDAAKSAPPDLIITDVNMPRLDGFGVISGIRDARANNTTPILVLTTERLCCTKALLSGLPLSPDGFIPRPL